MLHEDVDLLRLEVVIVFFDGLLHVEAGDVIKVPGNGFVVHHLVRVELVTVLVHQVLHNVLRDQLACGDIWRSPHAQLSQDLHS